MVSAVKALATVLDPLFMNEGVKAAAEPARRVAMASFMIDYCVGKLV